MASTHLEPPVSEANTPAPKKSKKKLVILLAGVLLLSAGGAGAAWFIMKKPAGDEAHAEEKPAHAAKPLFTSLDAFTVNLQDPAGDRYAQIGVTLQYEKPETEAAIKDHLPALRNDILLLIAAKRIDELLSPEGKQKLAQEIQAAVGKGLGATSGGEDDEDEDEKAKNKKRKKARKVENPVQAVLFSQFIVQ